MCSLARRKLGAPNIASEQEKNAAAKIYFTTWRFFHRARNENFSRFLGRGRVRRGCSEFFLNECMELRGARGLRGQFWYLWKSCVCCVNVGTSPAILFACPLRLNRRESRADTPRRFGGREIVRDARRNQGHADVRARTAFPQQKVITRALLQDN